MEDERDEAGYAPACGSSDSVTTIESSKLIEILRIMPCRRAGCPSVGKKRPGFGMVSPGAWTHPVARDRNTKQQINGTGQSLWTGCWRKPRWDGAQNGSYAAGCQW